MNEWQTIAWFAGIGSLFLGIVWRLVESAKKDLSERIAKTEHVLDNICQDCAVKKDEFLTIKAFDRFEHHLSTRVDGLLKTIEHLTKRVDDLIFTLRGKEHQV